MRLLGDPAALNQPDYQHDHGKHQQKVDGSPEGVVADHTEGPHEQKNDKNCEHRNFLRCILTPPELLELFLPAM
jgi:hypothetical protein